MGQCGIGNNEPWGKGKQGEAGKGKQGEAGKGEGNTLRHAMKTPISWMHTASAHIMYSHNVYSSRRNHSVRYIMILLESRFRIS